MAVPGLKVQLVETTADGIVRLVANHFHISEEKLSTNRRFREIVYPREIAMWLMCNRTNMLLREIGMYFNRHYTTVISARDHINDLMDSDSLIKEEIESILDKFKRYYQLCHKEKK